MRRSDCGRFAVGADSDQGAFDLYGFKIIPAVTENSELLAPNAE
jgi:hypothetical protein